jgi:hypothetical protein
MGGAHFEKTLCSLHQTGQSFAQAIRQARDFEKICPMGPEVVTDEDEDDDIGLF